MGTRRRRRGGFAWFFSKQLLAFLALAFLVIVVDFFLYAFIAVWESDQHFDQGSPATLTRRVDAGPVSYTHLARTCEEFSMEPGVEPSE